MWDFPSIHTKVPHFLYEITFLELLQGSLNFMALELSLPLFL